MESPRNLQKQFQKVRALHQILTYSNGIGEPTINQDVSMHDAPVAGTYDVTAHDSLASEARSGPAEVRETGVTSATQSPPSDAGPALRNLTLPTVPNLDIPPSPPESPPAGMNQKVAQFLELKKKGTHFNERLVRSSASKNPSLLGKLMTFAGLEPTEQYATTLPSNLWDPQGFPAWAYKDELAKAQHEAQKKLEEDRARSGRGAADFVAASESEQPSRSGTPSGKGTRGSASDRVMAGLSRDRERSTSRFESSSTARRRSRSPGRRP